MMDTSVIHNVLDKSPVRRASTASEPPERSERRSGQRATVSGESEGRSPSEYKGGRVFSSHQTSRRLWGAALVVFLAGASPCAAQVTPAAGYTPPDDTPSIKV